jgi:alkaline phosphatase D
MLLLGANGTRTAPSSVLPALGRAVLGGIAPALRGGTMLVLSAMLALGCAAPGPRPQPMRPEPAPPQPAAVASTALASAPAPLPVPPPPFRIAFGSCNDTRLPQTFWTAVAAQSPDLWIWLGDNVYADTTDMTVMRGLYDALRADPGYAALRARTRVIGTWDDHDYGHNNAGREYPLRVEAQQRLLDFLDEPEHSPRRAQQGVYASYDFGSPPHQVRVILLDTRYHRDPPGSAGDVLGPAQWSWLEGQLRGSQAAVHVIGSSIQVVAEEHKFEKWANFPAARERLLRLIAESGAANPLVLSGDRHFAELSRLALAPAGPELYDLTSSSLNRPWKGASETNRHRVGVLYPLANFGVVDIDWAGQQIVLQIRDQAGQAQLEARLALQQR